MLVNLHFQNQILHSTFTLTGNFNYVTYYVYDNSVNPPTDSSVVFDPVTYASGELFNFSVVNAPVLGSSTRIWISNNSSLHRVPSDYMKNAIVTKSGSVSWIAVVKTNTRWTVASASGPSGNGPFIFDKDAYNVGDNVTLILFNIGLK